MTVGGIDLEALRHVSSDAQGNPSDGTAASLASLEVQKAAIGGLPNLHKVVPIVLRGEARKRAVPRVKGTLEAGYGIVVNIVVDCGYCQFGRVWFAPMRWYCRLLIQERRQSIVADDSIITMMLLMPLINGPKLNQRKDNSKDETLAMSQSLVLLSRCPCCCRYCVQAKHHSSVRNVQYCVR
jgi:hypothetical protein